MYDTEGQQLRYCGIDSSYDDVIIKGDPGEMKFIAYYVKGSQIVAVATWVLRLFMLFLY
jgi:hypothetical protein